MLFQYQRKKCEFFGKFGKSKNSKINFHLGKSLLRENGKSKKVATELIRSGGKFYGVGWGKGAKASRLRDIY